MAVSRAEKKRWVNMELIEVPAVLRLIQFNGEPGTLYSEPFYVSRNSDRFKRAYKMRLSVITIKENDHLAVSLYLMSGDQDDTLQWPLKGDCSIGLLGNGVKPNYVRAKNVFHNRVADGEQVRFWHCSDFISRSDVRQNFLIGGNSLRFFVDIVPDDVRNGEH